MRWSMTVLLSTRRLLGCFVREALLKKQGLPVRRAGRCWPI